MNKRVVTAGAVALTLVVAACGSDNDSVADVIEDAEQQVEEAVEGAEEAVEEAVESVGDAVEDVEEAVEGAVEEAVGDAVDAACDPLPTVNEGVLTVATGEPVFPPWMGAGEDDFDDPTTGTGYEGALVYALAAELGFDDDAVEWVRTGFDEVIAPGSKDWDFNIQQFSITEQRDEVVDFSAGYYQVEQAIIGASDGPAAGATSLDDLRELEIGAAIGTTSLDYAEMVIAPSSDVQVYDDNAAAKAAFDAGQVDAIVFDLPTAYFITAVEITDASVIGVLPRTGGAPEELGMLFEDGSDLVPCVNLALAALFEDGTIDAIEDEWLNQGGSIPTLSE